MVLKYMCTFSKYTSKYFINQGDLTIPTYMIFYNDKAEMSII